MSQCFLLPPAPTAGWERLPPPGTGPVLCPTPFHRGLTEVSQGSGRCMESRERPGQEGRREVDTGRQTDSKAGRAGSRKPSALTVGRVTQNEERKLKAPGFMQTIPTLTRPSFPGSYHTSLLLVLTPHLDTFRPHMGNRSRTTHTSRPRRNRSFWRLGSRSTSWRFLWLSSVKVQGQVQRPAGPPTRQKSRPL